MSAGTTADHRDVAATIDMLRDVPRQSGDLALILVALRLERIRAEQYRHNVWIESRIDFALALIVPALLVVGVLVAT